MASPKKSTIPKGFLSASPIRKKPSSTRFEPYPRGGRPPKSPGAPRGAEPYLDSDTPETPTSSLPLDIRQWVQAEYINKFRVPPGPRTVRKVFIETAAEYTRSRGLAVRAREHDYDIIRYTHPKGGRAIPVVFMCKQNITGADGLQPSEHAAVYTPSTVLQKVVALGDFHLIIRSGTQSKAGPREQVRYLGLYEVHDPKSPLLPDRFTSLDETDQIHMQRFLRARQPHGTELNDKDIKKLPEAGELQLMVLQCKQFNKEFYTQLLQADAVTPVPVEGPMRTHPNWKKVRAQMLRLIEQSAIGGDDNSDA